MEDRGRPPQYSGQHDGNNGFNPSNQQHGFASYGEAPRFGVHLVCGHCSQTFVVRELTPTSVFLHGRGMWGSSLVQCSHCGKVSSSDRSSTINRSLMALLMFFIFVVFAAGITVFTWSEAQQMKLIYVFWMIAMAMTLVPLSMALYWCRMKISVPVSSRV